MRCITAACIHEGFLLASPMESIKKLQMTLLELCEEESKDITLALIPNIKTLIERYCNDHALSQLPDAPDAKGDNTPTKGNYGLAHASSLDRKFLGGDFGSMRRKYELGSGKGFGSSSGYKKMPTMMMPGSIKDEPVEETSA